MILAEEAMEQFENIMMKHGEHGLQAILENWERHYRVSHPRPMTLEERWDHFIRATEFPTAVAA